MIQFLKSTLSERGEPSFKRAAATGLLIVFACELGINLFTGKAPEQSLQNQLFELILVAFGSVLSVNIGNVIKDIKAKQSDNNAKVGEPSPQPDTTIVKEEVKP